VQTRTAWVVGASSGLGEASAQALAEQGWTLRLSARPGPRLDEALARLALTGPSATALPLDLSDEPAVAAALAALRDRDELPDAVVLSGGGPPPSRASDAPIEAWDEAYRLLLRPVAQVIRELGPAMAERGSGVIVVVTSSGVKEPIPGLATSNAMRAAVTSLVKTAADELAPAGVRLVCVAPGRIATERIATLDAAAAARQGSTVEEAAARSRSSIPIGRYGRPEEFGKVVAFLCSDHASYVTGITVSVDGGKNRGVLS
jgi:3-oxoacyl-[acyl-carrier protein] reductase